jgi:carboxymethylenebutenolidase
MIHEDREYLNRPGGKLPVFIAAPDARNRHPAVIVVHEIFGLNDHIVDVCRRFADAGFAAFAPDLFFYAKNLPTDRNDLAAMRSVWASIPDRQFAEDLHAVHQYACDTRLAKPDQTGTIGFCMGGAMALMFACESPQVAWCADLYGRIFYPELSETKPKHPIDYVEDLHCPLLGAFAGKDDLITADHIEKLKERLTAAGKRFDIQVYKDAQHAFFNDQRQFYNAEAAADVWTRTLDFAHHSVKEPT